MGPCSNEGSIGFLYDRVGIAPFPLFSDAGFLGRGPDTEVALSVSN
jgi:hypothetical protein